MRPNACKTDTFFLVWRIGSFPQKDSLLYFAFFPEFSLHLNHRSMKSSVIFLLELAIAGFLCSCSQSDKAKLPSGPRRIEILFLGHDSEHHNSARNMPILSEALSKEGINFTYTDNPADLNKENLSRYDGLMIYSNHEKITADEEEALLDFVGDGKGFMPIHCASFCFQNSPKYIDLVGGQFLKHDTATFVATIINKEHPVMQGVDTFATWDETYIHTKLSDDRTVLMERVEGEHHEPWTWVKEYGKGRVFYTAYGHDERTWSNPGFQKLVRQGILWAVGDEVRKQWEDFAKTIPELTYKDMPGIPNYEKRNPAPKYQEPLSPEASAKLIQVPSGFDLELFASEPNITNPIAMNWDERGRLWVIETVDYPNTVLKEEGIGDDRIKICEDTDGDGKADKFTVFADKLNIPTSFAFVNGGIIVSQAPTFLFLKDTDGDDHADVREVILDGWGTFDTHAGPSNLQYAFDNEIWGVVGYSGFKGTVAGEARSFDQGIYRFAPDLSSFDVVTRTTNNTWGLGFSENNDVFASTANNTHSVYMGISDQAARGVEGIPLGSVKIDGHYAMHPITDKVRQVDVFGGFTAASGHNFYTARAYPKKYWDHAALVCEPTGHLVHIAWIEKTGAGFLEKDGWNLFAGADEWVAPVAANVGPDGAVWVLDWYNFIVQHNPTPTPERGGYQASTGAGNAYENPLRDKTRGRIWRVVWRGAAAESRKTLSKDRPDELIKALSSNNRFWRMTAQRLLVERKNMDVLPKLYELIRDEKTDDEGNNFGAQHALWTLQGLHLIQSGNEAFQVVTQALKHPSAFVRKAAIQVLSPVQWTEKTILESRVLEDPDPNTRLAALVSLVKAPASNALGQKLFDLSNEEAIRNDNWLAKAVYVAAATHREGFLASFEKANPNFDKSEAVSSRELASYKDDTWKTMALPQSIEHAGLDIDGVVWFRKTIDVPAVAARAKATLSLGPIDDSDETWVNGTKVGATHNQYRTPRVYPISSGVLRAGKNIVAIRMEDTGNRGGLYGKEEDLFLKSVTKTISLGGEWKYEIERRYNADNTPIFRDASISELFARTYLGKTLTADTSSPAVVKNATVIHLKVVENQMKYDLKNFTVEAGKPVRIVFSNPDFMQHNLVITTPASMEIVGKAADILATDPKGAASNYVPDVPQVLFHTRLLNPQETVTLEFVAPSRTGEYPYVCTFPGHWRIMNGMMKVVPASSPL
jgi:putative membrane-bound dehydrogenase-like protein